ncbi:TetR/AcrR family transcriptional regulator [Humibacter ginsenosidimutans]|uniref:Helix-turn-helix transcriptional regulator n=1 Tax=Humibacter ginsenosidimutans TaxID=2599293 RepID=A0A5B8M8Y2_9MICO|nr:TetR/AcrR family transcriptional regulator [Humibacter ginsenosidimutans]QDZ15850.1 helix-turn-helix transcriptional regulator [Humibacter ginsenosidimutans]
MSRETFSSSDSSTTSPESDDAAPAREAAAATAPKLRADAARNRGLLLVAARDAFTAADDDAAVSLEGIARAAGVGIGTLYRNFPTREALVEALYRTELDDVVESAHGLLDGRAAFDALRLWLDRYARFVATKQGMMPALRAAWSSRAARMAETRERIEATIGDLLAAGGADGSIRPDADAADTADMLVGVFLAMGDAHDTRRVGRLLDLIMDALRPAASSR